VQPTEPVRPQTPPDTGPLQPRPDDLTSPGLRDRTAESRTEELTGAPPSDPEIPDTEHYQGPVPPLLARDKPTVAGYDVLDLLGAGTYGEVWLAREHGTEILVAIKFFSRGPGQQWQQLQADVKHLAQLDGVHGIVQLKDVEPAAPRPYYVMAYAEGRSLEDRLGKGPLSVPEALALFRQVTEALAYVHAKGIRHCDLKPGNVLLDSRGRPLIADFGQAQLPHDKSPALGTYFYMAPEQANLDQPLPDTRWDVYALGALFYRMVTGELPRDDERLRAELTRSGHVEERLRTYREGIARAPRPARHRRCPAMDWALADLIDGCLELDPARRLLDAGAVLTALRRREHWNRHRPLLFFGLAAPLLLLIVMTAVGLAAGESAIDQSRAALTRNLLQGDAFAARLVANVVKDKLTDRRKGLERCAQDPKFAAAVRARDLDGARKILHNRLEVPAYKDFTSLLLANPEGDCLLACPVDEAGGREKEAARYCRFLGAAGQGPLHTLAGLYEPNNFAYRDWFQGKGDHAEERETARGRYPPITDTHVSHPYRGLTSGRFVIAISTPVRDRDNGRLVGVLQATIALERLNEWITDVGGEDGAVVALVDGHCYPVLHSKAHPEAGNVQPVGEETFGLLLEQSAAGTDADFRDPTDGRTYLAAFAPVPGINRSDTNGAWLAVVEHDKEAALRPVHELKGRLITLGGVMLAAFALVSTGLWGWLLWTIRRNENAGHA
jgi:eukaryotic-like serine/threonine-protein kinase